MLTLFKNEMKLSYRNLLIWIVCVAGTGLACILLYSGVQDQMKGVADSFASMGAFSAAFGMDQMSIGTITGYYAMEITVILGLGGAMFSAIISMSILTKEEDAHTSEFLYTLPITRAKAVWTKWIVVMTQIILFNVLSTAIFRVGFVMAGEEIATKEFLTFHAMQTLMQIEIAAICFGISAFMKKSKMGIGLGIVLLLYAFDLLSRVVPKLSDVKFLSPFAYANATDIFTSMKIPANAVIFGCVLLIAGVATAFGVYTKRDLAT